MLKRMLFLILMLVLPMMQVAQAQEDDALPQRLTVQSPQDGLAVTVAVPNGWNVRYDNGEVVVANTESAFAEVEGDLPPLDSFDVVIWFSVNRVEQPATVEVIEDLKSELFTYEATEPVVVDDLAGFSAAFSAEHLQGKAFVLDYSEGLVLAAVAASGAYADYESDILAIIAAFEAQPLEVNPDAAVVMVTGEDEDLSFSLEFPEDWIMHTGGGLAIGSSSSTMNSMVSSNEPELEGDDALFFIVSGDLGEGETPAETLENQIMNAEDGTVFGEIQDFELYSYTGAQVSFDAPFGSGTVYLTADPEMPMFFFTLAGDPAGYEANIPNFMRIIESFVITMKAE